MRFPGILMFATVFGLVSVATAATTELETTTVRAKPSSTAKAIAKLPAGSTIDIVGQEGAFTKVKFKGGKEGYIATTQLNVGSKDVTKAMGTTVANRTGYGQADVAAAINMGVPVDASRNLAKNAKSATADVTAAADEIGDEFESLPEDVTSTAEETVGAAGDAAAAVGSSATNQLKKKKNQAVKDAEGKAAELESATNAKKIKGDAEAKKNEAMNAAKSKQNEMTNAAAAKQNEVTGAVNQKRAEADKAVQDASVTKMTNKGKKALADKQTELEGEMADQMGDLESQKDGLEDQVEGTDVAKMAAGAKAGAARAKGSVTGIGDMSSVEALEAVQFSKSDFSSASPFVSEGRLKSKTLK